MKRVLGVNHPSTLMTAYHTANTLCKQGTLGEDEEILRATLPVQTRVLGEDHPWTMKTAASLRDITATGDKECRPSATLDGGGGGGGGGGGDVDGSGGGGGRANPNQTNGGSPRKRRRDDD